MINEALGSTLAARALTFGYSNSRVKSMKQGLLGGRELPAIAEAKSIDEVYGLLERTQYRQDLVSSSLKEKTLADQIELACTKNFSRSLAKISEIAPKLAKPKIKGLFEKSMIGTSLPPTCRTTRGRKITPSLATAAIITVNCKGVVNVYP